MFIIFAPLVLQILMDPNAFSLHLLSYRSCCIFSNIHILSIFSFILSSCFRNFDICVHVVQVSNLAMGGHKTNFYGDVSYKGSASPLHLEWTAHVRFYSQRYCLMFFVPINFCLFVCLIGPNTMYMHYLVFHFILRWPSTKKVIVLQLINREFWPWMCKKIVRLVNTK